MQVSNRLLVSTLWVAAASLRSVRAFVPPNSLLQQHQQHTAQNKPLFLLDKLFGTMPAQSSKYPIYAEESVMSKKAHGTSDKPVMKNLRWKCDYDTADRICNFNRHYAEFAGYWTNTEFLQYVKENYKEGDPPLKFYDSVTGKLLFQAPVNRSMEAFLKESSSHGWPSFRDDEVNWDYVRCLRDGEAVSVSGTHLGHNLPDSTGNRYWYVLVWRGLCQPFSFALYAPPYHIFSPYHPLFRFQQHQSRECSWTTRRISLQAW